MIIPVILSGGAGTRLWPLSTPEKPKQFLPLVSRHSLFQETLGRLEGLPGLSAPVIVCNESHRFLVAEQLREIGAAAAAIVLEPEGRNTAPAIGVAAMLAQRAVHGSEPGFAAARKGSDPAGDRAADPTSGPAGDRAADPTSGATANPSAGTSSGPSAEGSADPILLVLPADHVIADAGAFREAVRRAATAAEAGKLVTFGIVPTRAETGYGYIEQGAEEGAWSAVARFVEKPDRATAESYVATGRYLWNSGMFVFGARAFEAELKRCVPAIHAACRAAAAGARRDADFTRLGPEFLDSPSDSVDYAVMERTGLAAVVALDAGWSDVGSWAALYDALDKDADGNVLRGDAVTLDASNCLALPNSRRVALLGLDNVVVIDSGDTVLVMRKDRSQDIKILLQKAAD